MVKTEDQEGGLPVWDKPVDVDEKWIQFVDDNVMTKLPPGCKVKGITPFGASYWTRTAEISTVQADGSDLSFFLKVAQHDTGKAMVSGEFVSMSTIYKSLPYIVPHPYASGTYASDPNIHFFLCGFVDMDDDLPDAQKLARGLAELHETGVNPDGKYGFHVPTLQGTIPQYTEWTETWEEFFSNSIRRVFENEERSQGYDKEVHDLCNLILAKVVPRLLRPLETGGRIIKPRLVHGDIWDGNVSTDLNSNTPVIFDATCIYAHNEIELAPLRPIRHRMGKQYVKAYFDHFQKSNPEEDQDDRNALYCLRWDMNCSTLYPGNLRYRKLSTDVMRYFVNKFPEGYEGWARARGEEPVARDYLKPY
ncbi:Fructosamine kinase-domain-containing protein [Usnea florida]